MSVGDIYTNGKYLANNPTWHEESSPWKASQIMKLLTKHQLNPQSICEVGCGAGEILHQLYLALSEHIQFYGYDISPQAYEFSKKKENSRLHFYTKDFLNESDRYWNVLLAIDVIEHVEDYYAFLRVIKGKADYKILHIPLDISVQKILFGTIGRRRDALGHIHFFTKETALAALADCDYQILDHFYTSQVFDLRMPSFKLFLAKCVMRAADAVISTLFDKDVSVYTLGGRSLMVLAR